MQQTKRANPLYSPFGCGSALLLAFMLGVTLYLNGGTPFSPGELTALHPQNQPLDGFASHADFEGECRQCHTPFQGITADRCERCHTDIAQERQTDAKLHGRFANAAACQSCHTDHAGRDAKTTQLALNDFDHARSLNFSLAQHKTNYDGSAMGCEDCHQNGRFDPAWIDCADCHTNADPQFMLNHTILFGDDCLACHDGIDTMADFDHTAVFPLEDGHALVACQDCHIDNQFQNASADCAACHQEPDVHVGQFGIDCARCHTVVAWSPAQLTAHTFPLDHESDAPIACETCHTKTYADYTCYGCHEHTPDNTRVEHLEEGIRDFENCIECHPTGREEEGESHD